MNGSNECQGTDSPSWGDAWWAQGAKELEPLQPVPFTTHLFPAGNQPCPLGSVEGFSLARRRWEALPVMPTARCSCSSLQAGPRLFVIGGVAQGPSQAVEALCLRDGV